jgi:hypothetical protein
LVPLCGSSASLSLTVSWLFPAALTISTKAASVLAALYTGLACLGPLIMFTFFGATFRFASPSLRSSKLFKTDLPFLKPR